MDTQTTRKTDTLTLGEAIRSATGSLLTTQAERASDGLLKARRCYRFDHMWTGGPVCPECEKLNPRASARRERILLAAQLRGAARGLGAGWAWLERAADLLTEGQR